MDIFSRILRRLRRELNMLFNWQKVRQISRSFPIELLESRQSPVIFFNASTRLSGLSQNAGFSLITSLALRINKVPTHFFVCNRGLRPCVLGTDKKDPTKEPPCGECLRTSRLILGKKNVHYFPFNFCHEISREIAGFNLNQLLTYTYEDIPLGKLVLPSMRWILRKHHLSDTKANRMLAQSYIQSAWNVYQEFAKLIESIHPQSVVVFNGMFFPEAVARLTAQRQNVPVYSHEF